MITFYLGGLTSMHGGIVYIFYLARLLSDNGIEAKVLINSYPNWLETGFEDLVTNEVKGTLIMPECFYNGNGIPLIQAPNLWKNLDKCKVALSSSPFITGRTSFQVSCYTLPPFIFTKNFKENSGSDNIATIKLVSAEVKKLLDLSGINPKVISGTHQQVMDTLPTYETFVYPVFNSGIDFPLIEAMASGCTVFCGRNSGSAGFIRDGLNCYVIDSPEDFERIYPERDMKMGWRARDFIFTYYSEKAVKFEICNIFAKIIDWGKIG